jgi:trafficking protein particle complex subunit 10
MSLDEDKNNNPSFAGDDEVSSAKSPSLSSSVGVRGESFYSSAPSSSSGGFFSLGESNIAERARRLKLEQQASVDSDNGELKESINNVSSAEDATDSMDAAADSASDLHEFDSLLISNQIHEKENVFYKTLLDGFKSLKVLRDDFTDDVSVQQVHLNNRRKYSATVNFIDPTTKSTPQSSTTPVSATNMLQQQSRLQKQESNTPTNSIQNVYEKITQIFETEYKSTLRSVQYKNVRTGETDFISSLPVNPVITRTGIATDTKTTKTVNTPWGGTSSTAIVPVSDPAEWHTGPFCHVYIAACENIDHYQTKVKPALQAFVSQIESAASNTAANQQGGHSADYLIVYIPVGGGASASNIKDSNLSPDGSSALRGGLFQRARKRWTVGTAATTGEDDDVKSSGSLDSGGGEGNDTTDVDDPDAIAMSVALNLLSKAEQKVYKRIITDFPNGKACVLSTISLDQSKEAMANPDAVAIRTQEWNTFNRMLGAVVVNGFMDRCRRYKDELKRLDAQRAIAATAAKNSQGSGIGNSGRSQKPNPYAFNLGHFFLVKESLAFTYEQMQLPAEALLQYDEFRLYMPDLSDKEEKKVRRARRKSKALRDEDQAPTLTELADSGDFLGFRKRVRTEYDLTAVLDIMRRYLFARELSLLFRMEEPVELLNRCQSFVKAMYAVMLRGINDLHSEDERNQRRSDAAMWVVQFSWDIKTASEPYFRSTGDSTDDRSVGSLGSGLDSSVHDMAEKSDEAVAAKISELLETSRVMFMQLGDSKLNGPNPLRVLHHQLPDDLNRKWTAWTPPDISDKGDDGTKRRASASRNHSMERQCFFQNSFSSAASFEESFLGLCEATIKMSRKAKRRRLAARLQAEVAEYFVRNGNFASAIPIFKQVLKRYRVDQWDRLHFWRLFRLAFCQRTTSKPTEYLKTLVSSFSPRSTAIAPVKALCALLDDLEAVLKHPSVGNARYGKLSFIETSLQISHSSDKRMTIGEGSERKEVVKRFSSVGENLEIELTIWSYLPRAIDMDSVKLFIVTFDDFMNGLEANASIEEDQAFKVIRIDAPVTLNPGLNEFTIAWSPSGIGQYILSTVEMVWKEGYFYYDSLDLPGPLLGIDVLPSEPTHFISISPESLVPGHDQEIAITIDAGSDILTSATLLLTGTNDVFLLPPNNHPGTSEWTNDFEVDIPPMNPGEKRTLKANVRCVLPEEISSMAPSPKVSVDDPNGLNAQLLSMYRNSEAGANDEKDVALMKTVVESFTPVLNRNILTIKNQEIHWLEPHHRFLLNLTLTSNTPYRFCLEEWKIQLPSPVTLLDELVLNQDLTKRFVSEGDHLAFAFDCRIRDENHNSTLQEPSIRIGLRDSADKSISLDLALDLAEVMSTVDAAKPLNHFFPTTLKLNASKGQVGQPVLMKYSVDLSGLTADVAHSKVAFSVYSHGGSWLVSGRVKGVLENVEGGGSCEVLATPIVSGMLDRFPKIALFLVPNDGGQVPLPVDLRSPDLFEAVSGINDIAVAAPTSSKSNI